MLTGFHDLQNKTRPSFWVLSTRFAKTTPYAAVIYNTKQIIPDMQCHLKSIFFDVNHLVYHIMRIINIYIVYHIGKVSSSLYA